MAIRIIRGYRTISFEAATILARFPPMDILADMDAKVYDRMRIVRQTSGGQPITAFAVAIRREEKQNALAAWHSRLCEEPYVHKRVVEAILPVFKDWMDQKDGRLTYRLTQVITGHGCFSDYLNKIGREATSNCHHCGGTAQDSADHTLAQCSAWDGERRALTGRIGSNLSCPQS
ncbi:uncharacterized protein LOC119189843 [Manduca sexta]|uniref:uncharacterized protein LOC119189843 n=1 Tax=Manduca sexta TaxID=7130 RepID=UPI00188E3022|nr:uncharacterized protein LOC119189843 [Manduca sexta]